jgi:hypothetical protein
VVEVEQRSAALSTASALAPPTERPSTSAMRTAPVRRKATVRQHHGSGDDLASNSGKIIYS